jgi:hypothetical protein
VCGSILLPRFFVYFFTCLRVAATLHEAIAAVKLRHRQVNGKSKKEKMFESIRHNVRIDHEQGCWLGKQH